MSEILHRDSTTDNYQILSSYTNSQTDSERSIVQALVQGTLYMEDTESNIYTSPANDSSWNLTDLSDNYIDTSAIFNYPAGTVTENSVIYVDLSNNDASFNTYTTNISSTTCNNNTYSFSSLPTSAPYYDSNYVVTQSINNQCYDDASAVEFLFDNSNPNLKIQYAMQSRWNTKKGPYTDLSDVGPDTLAVTQDVSFNTTQAFGEKGTAINDPSGISYNSYWASVNSTDGSVLFNLIGASNQPITNNLYVKNRDMSGVTLNLTDDVGIFRIQKGTPLAETYLNNVLVSNSNVLNDIPMFNGNGTNPIDPSTVKSAAASNLVPGVITYQQFESLFNNEVFNTINNGWEFNIDISSNNGGYTLADPHIAVSELDNSNIKDNLYYMQNYVTNLHHIDISSGTVTINASTDGVSTIASSINIDLSNGEVLDTDGAGINGEIIIRLNDITNRVENISSLNVTNTRQLVYYPSDVSNPSDAIDNEEQTNPRFEVMWQKVAQNTEYAPSSDYLVRNNNAILTLFTDRVVDSSYNTTDFDLSFNSTLAGTDAIKLWRINLSNNIIINPESFYTDSTYNNVVQSISTLGVLRNITEGITYNDYRMLLTAKDIPQISLAVSIDGVSGWRINYANNDDTFLKSSSDSAYSTTQNLPKYSSDDINLINDGYDLSYSYTYSTRENAIRSGGLVDYVEVKYSSVDGTTIPETSFVIPQSEITRTYSDSIIAATIVDDASYSFSGSVFNKVHWELVHIVSDSSYNATFSPHFGPFDNILLHVDNIQQNNTYYAVRNKTSSGYAPQSALSYVVAPQISDLKRIYETISPASGNTLSINGIFTSSDLKPFTSIVQASYDKTVWTPITTGPINTDTYYGLLNNNNIIDSVAGEIATEIEYTPFTSTNNDAVLLELENYYIPFFIDASNSSYTLSSFESTPSNLSNTTTIGGDSFYGNVHYLSVQNNYDVTSSWYTNNYTSNVVRDGADIIFTVKDSLDNTVFTITVNDNTIFLGTIIVSYIPYDTYRANRLLGSVASPTFQQLFGFTNYNYPTLGDGLFGLTGIPGVYITNQSSDYSPSNSPSLGSYQSFKVVGDYMNIAYYGTTTPPSFPSELGRSYNNGSLTFQYNSGVNYSAVFTFPLYRGYGGASATNQYYIINRTATSANFIVDSNNGSYTQLTDNLTTNMYYNQPFIVDELRNTTNDLCADLNISGSFNYSILPDSENASYNITVTGDTLNVSIRNPNYFGSASDILVPAGSTPVSNPKEYFAGMSLKDYGVNNMYTFSGNWYLNNELMGIRPSRVKLTNEDYTDTLLNYRIQFMTPFAGLFKANSDISYNWLGNPLLYGSQSPDANLSPNNWTLVRGIDQEDFYNGFNIGTKKIYQDRNLPITLGVAYYVSVPPYDIYEQMSTEFCPQIPYNYGVEYNSNRTTRYYPYTGTTTVFNPFASSVSFTDISGNVSTVTNNQEYLNNITFNLRTRTPTDLSELYVNPDNQRITAVVPGTNIEINLYSGLYNSILPGNHTNPIYSGPITSISNIPDITNTNIVLRNRDASGGINFSLLQYPSDIGYPSGPAGYNQILHTNNQSQWYNIDMYMGNTSWFNNNSGVTFFNFHASGIFPTLYTVVDMNNPLTQSNFRRVYKYSSPLHLDIDLSNGLVSDIQTLTMVFNSREYCDISVSGGTFPTNTSGIWNYTTILRDTNIGNTPITWITDSSFTGNVAYTGWSFGNNKTSTNMLAELLSVQDTQQKWTFITLDPFTKYENQFGVSVGSVAWDGSVTAPLVNTRVLQLHPGITNPVLLNNNTTIEQYSESTL